MTAEQIALLFPTKPSSDNDFKSSHSLWAVVSLPLAQIDPAKSHDITRL